MVKLDAGSTLKRLRNRYRLVVMNDDTYEEVATFKLSRLSVYIMLSTVFVVLVGLTVALIVFTPLKYYIPGASTDYKTASELRELKYRVDQAEKENKSKAQYIESIKKALTGTGNIQLDTSTLTIPKEDFSDD
ncbi:MAG TPA: hypothetical protein PKC72_16700 [Chitinophagaceae bacterium]|nr:hypothetical protein [Chitinophagaceae bacterium]